MAYELDVEVNRIASDERVKIQTAKIEAEAKVKVSEVEAKSRRRMDGETRGIVLGVIAALIFLGGCVSWWGYNISLNTEATLDQQRQQTQVTTACVTAGSEWKQNIAGKFECVRPTIK